jgi:hypothetical protein
MATQKEFGPGTEFKYDNLQVAMPTPDATAALLSGAAEINNHFSEPPFQYQELKKRVCAASSSQFSYVSREGAVRNDADRTKPGCEGRHPSRG